MGKRYLSILFLFFISCGATKTVKEVRNTSTDILITKDSVSVVVEALNLSEDMSRLSTKNDELLLLLYKMRPAETLDKYIWNKQFVLDQSASKIQLSISKPLLETSSTYLLVLIEQDSETPLEQIDPIIRVHYNQLLKAYKNRNYREIEKFIGDEDILGIKTITYQAQGAAIELRFTGMQRLDQYDYLLKIGTY